MLSANFNAVCLLLRYVLSDTHMIDSSGNFRLPGRLTVALLCLSVNVYKCQYLVSSCGRCLLLDPEFDCIWCEDRKQCSRNNDCAGQIITRDQICPNPQITSVSNLN